MNVTLPVIASYSDTIHDPRTIYFTEFEIVAARSFVYHHSFRLEAFAITS